MYLVLWRYILGYAVSLCYKKKTAGLCAFSKQRGKEASFKYMSLQFSSGLVTIVSIHRHIVIKWLLKVKRKSI